jgi:hypothetical protein
MGALCFPKAFIWPNFPCYLSIYLDVNLPHKCGCHGRLRSIQINIHGIKMYERAHGSVVIVWHCSMVARLRNYATSQKVPGLRPNEVNDFHEFT